MLTAKNLKLELQNKIILNNVSFDIHGGEFTALIGANGAGKSSLLTAISKPHVRLQGQIEFHQRPIKEWLKHPRKLAQCRALMPQFHQLNFGFTVQQVVQMGRLPYQEQHSPKDEQRIIAAAMHKAGVYDLKNISYTKLSGGQQARVQFARVLSQLDLPLPFPSRPETDPRADTTQADSQKTLPWNRPTSTQNKPAALAKLLLLDEPTASLDLRYQQQVLRLCKQLAQQGLGVVAVLHDLNLAAQYADKIGLMHQGQLVALGKPQEVLQSKLLSDCFGLPVQVLSHAIPGRLLIAV